MYETIQTRATRDFQGNFLRWNIKLLHSMEILGSKVKFMNKYTQFSHIYKDAMSLHEMQQLYNGFLKEQISEMFVDFQVKIQWKKTDTRGYFYTLDFQLKKDSSSEVSV